MREFFVIASSTLIAALIVGAGAAAVTTFMFYDVIFAPGYTEHQRGIAWSIVGASTLGSALLVVVIGTFYWFIRLCFRVLAGKPTQTKAN